MKHIVNYFFYIIYLILITIFPVKSYGDETEILKVMSFNILYDGASTEYPWQARRNTIASLIQNEMIDIAGIQEDFFHQVVDLGLRLLDYRYVGVGYTDGREKGLFNTIFYRKDRFTLIDSGDFWISETPNTPGLKGWDAANVRKATWAILENVQNKKRLFVINTHLDNIGQVARIEGVKLLLKKIDELYQGLPIIVTGDFNSDPASESIQQIYSNTYTWNLVHTKDIAKIKEGSSGTWHGFGVVPEDKRNFVDYIFVSESMKVLRHIVVMDKYKDVYISDHAPIITDIQF
jgi:endonuclease/exonuclease/phosphatase family metal-dependent hydrolase